MILGSHNSLSYDTPISWWMKLINFTSKCQSLNLKEQFDYGVRLFDIRVDLLDIENPASWDYARGSHGIVTYNIFVNDALNYLNDKAKTTKDPVYVFLNVENLKYEGDEYIDNFIDYFKFMKNRYKNLIFCGGYRKHPWIKIVHCEDPDIDMLFWEFYNYKYQSRFKNKIKLLVQNILHFSPKYWAKKNNNVYKYIYETGTVDERVIMLDYVQY